MKLTWKKIWNGGYSSSGAYRIDRSPRPGTSRTDWTVTHWILGTLTVCDRLGEAKRYAQEHANRGEGMRG